MQHDRAYHRCSTELVRRYREGAGQRGVALDTLPQRIVNPDVRSTQSLESSLAVEGLTYFVAAERLDEPDRPSEWYVYADGICARTVLEEPTRV